MAKGARGANSRGQKAVKKESRAVRLVKDAKGNIQRKASSQSFDDVVANLYDKQIDAALVKLVEHLLDQPHKILSIQNLAMQDSIGKTRPRVVSADRALHHTLIYMKSVPKHWKVKALARWLVVNEDIIKRTDKHFRGKGVDIMFEFQTGTRGSDRIPTGCRHAAVFDATFTKRQEDLGKRLQQCVRNRQGVFEFQGGVAGGTFSLMKDAGVEGSSYTHIVSIDGCKAAIPKEYNIATGADNGWTCMGNACAENCVLRSSRNRWFVLDEFEENDKTKLRDEDRAAQLDVIGQRFFDELRDELEEEPGEVGSADQGLAPADSTPGKAPTKPKAKRS